ncbi:MAG: 2-hydroxyacid dehydrogenase [Granulosicoccus sp.]
MRRKIAIIGDNFMLPDVFEEKILSLCQPQLDIRKLQQPWPDEPMEHGYAQAGMDNLKEYMGKASDVVDFIDDAEILVTQLAPLSRNMFEQLPQLKFVAVSRGGPVNIDMAAANDHGVVVVNTPGRNASAVAEFTLGAILAETRNIRRGHEGLRSADWQGDLYRYDKTGRELGELTVGVIGYGNIGTRVVRLLRAFGTKVLVADPYVQLSTDDLNAGVELVAVEELLDRADVVTMHARVTDETRQMMNAQTFAKMKKDALFVNTARGPLVNYDDLHDALTGDVIGSAMLETFAIEPVPEDYPLLSLPNVTLTPHIAGASVKTVTYAAEQVAMELDRYFKGLSAINANS